MSSEELQELLDSFLQRWPIDKVRNLSLEEYVGLDNHDTFCYWVEHKTRELGSMIGSTSFKFGIYERKDKDKLHKNFMDDEEYSWMPRYGQNRQEAFENVKHDLIRIIECAENGQLSLIDEIQLQDLFKWKVAFLYSNERLIPIYQQDTLMKIAKHFGLKTNKQTKISEIQELMIQSKPANASVHEYMRNLWAKFGSKGRKEGIDENLRKDNEYKPRTRKASENLNIENQLRTTSSRSYFIEQIHRKLQSALKEKLVKEFGADCVVLFEENNVDVKLIQPNHIVFYEVKSASYATNCIKEGLGQFLYYAFCDNDSREKSLVIVGQYPPTREDLKFIEYLKTHLNIAFEYESIRLG